MKVQKEQLLKSLQLCMPGVQNGASLIEGAEAVVFSNGTICSYNDKISVSVKFPMDFSGAVKAKEFYQLINKMPSSEIDFSEADGKITIRCGKSLVNLVLLSESILDRVNNLFESEPNWKALPSNFYEGLQLCKMGCNRSRFAGICVHRNSMYSTDVFQFSRFQLDSEMDCFWAEDPVISELMKIKNLTKYCLGNGWIHFESEDHVIFSCRTLPQDDYPFEKIDELILTFKQDRTIIRNNVPKDLSGAIDRASTLAQDIEQFQTIQISIDKNKIHLCSVQSFGDYSEQIDWDTAFKEDIPKVNFESDVSMILNGLKKSESIGIILYENEARCTIFEGKDFLYIANVVNS